MSAQKNTAFRLLPIGYWLIVVACLVIAYFILQSVGALPTLHAANENAVGTPIDSLNGVPVYYNGDISHVAGRNVARNGYNIGLQWQCVEFVKRYYLEHLGHQMPDAYGHAKDFYDVQLPDASYNDRRGLVQYMNPSLKKPEVNDIIVFDGHIGNRYGHIAIVSNVYAEHIEIIQQNPGPGKASRELLPLNYKNRHWHVLQRRCMGWLRVE
jgi:surface antigen